MALGQGAAAPGGGWRGVVGAHGVACRAVQQLEVTEEVGRSEHLPNCRKRNRGHSQMIVQGADVEGEAARALTRAVSVGGRRSAVAWAGEERGQATVVCLLAGEEGLTLISWGQQAGLRREAGQRV